MTVSPFDERLTRQTESCEPAVCRVYCSLMLGPGENETIGAPDVTAEPARLLATWGGHAYIPIRRQTPDISIANGVNTTVVFGMTFTTCNRPLIWILYTACVLETIFRAS